MNNFAGELKKLEEMGYGKVITRETIVADKKIPARRAASVYMKPLFSHVQDAFFKLASGADVSKDDYMVGYFEKQ